MAKKVVKKTKIKFLNLLIVLLVFLGLFFGVKYLLDVKIKNIIISGNNYLTDDYILELGDIKDYPSFILLQNIKVCNKIKKSKYINNCRISKKWGFILQVKVGEDAPLFYDTNINKYVLTSDAVDDDFISHNFRVPRLLNYVPDKKYEKFKTGMSKIDDDILSKISDIEYQPNEFDKDRFLLYMDDGNMVYLTLTKFKMINHYDEVLMQLEGHKGILYLDSGNHFKIME